MSDTPKILWPAIRQYRHNSGGDDLVHGFDEKETISIVSRLEAQNAELVEALEDSNGLLDIMSATLSGNVQRHVLDQIDTNKAALKAAGVTQERES